MPKLERIEIAYTSLSYRLILTIKTLVLVYAKLTLVNATSYLISTVWTHVRYEYPPVPPLLPKEAGGLGRLLTPDTRRIELSVKQRLDKLPRQTRSYLLCEFSIPDMALRKIVLPSNTYSTAEKRTLSTAPLDKAEVKIELSLTSNTYRRSSSDAPELVVKSTIANADVLIVELRGENDNGTILEDGFRIEHFNFYDLNKRREIINKDPFPGTCDPRFALQPYNVVELRSSSPLVMRQTLDDISPLSDPVRQLEVGHEYRITLKPQTVWGFAGSKKDLFDGQSSVDVDDLPDGILVRLESTVELKLKVEA